MTFARRLTASGHAVIRTCACLALLLSPMTRAFAQKPVIDTTAIRDWASVGGAKITNDGRFAAYNVHDYPAPAKVVLHELGRIWKAEIEAGDLSFTDDSRQA